MDEEGAVGQEGFGVFDRAAGAEDGVLREESDPVSIKKFTLIFGCTQAPPAGP